MSRRGLTDEEIFQILDESDIGDLSDDEGNLDEMEHIELVRITIESISAYNELCSRTKKVTINVIFF